MELEEQLISNDKNFRSVTLEDIKVLNLQYLATQAKTGEQVFSLMPLKSKKIVLMFDDTVEQSIEKETLNKTATYGEKRLGE